MGPDAVNLLELPLEIHESPELEVMLSGCATEPERKAVREAFNTFAEGDPKGFAAQFNTLLVAHARALKLAPEALKTAVTGPFRQVSDGLVSHRAAMTAVTSALSKDVEAIREQATLVVKDAEDLRGCFGKWSQALEAVLQGVVKEREAIHEATEAILSISERRIVLGLVAAFAAGVASCSIVIWAWRLFL
jgi:hypothetical protein